MKTSGGTVIEIEDGGYPAGKPALLKHSAPRMERSTAGVARHEPENGPAFKGAVVGRLVGLSESGTPLVHFSKMPPGSAIPAVAVLPVTLQDIGRDAVLLFDQGDPLKPILMGLMQQPAVPQPDAPPVEVRLDGEQLVLNARQEIVLRCGKASITLTRAGKVLIRGAYLLSRSSGANRIKGGSVQIN